MYFNPNNRDDLSNSHATKSLFPRNAFINTKEVQLFKFRILRIFKLRICP